MNSSLEDKLYSAHSKNNFSRKLTFMISFLLYKNYFNFNVIVGGLTISCPELSSFYVLIWLKKELN